MLVLINCLSHPVLIFNNSFVGGRKYITLAHNNLNVLIFNNSKPTYTHKKLHVFPPYKEGEFLIVSPLIKEEITYRKDLLCVGDVVPGYSGDVIVCKGGPDILSPTIGLS